MRNCAVGRHLIGRQVLRVLVRLQPFSNLSCRISNRRCLLLVSVDLYVFINLEIHSHPVKLANLFPFVVQRFSAG
jgi:hypothetical protein